MTVNFSYCYRWLWAAGHAEGWFKVLRYKVGRGLLWGYCGRLMQWRRELRLHGLMGIVSWRDKSVRLNEHAALLYIFSLSSSLVVVVDRWKGLLYLCLRCLMLIWKVRWGHDETKLFPLVVLLLKKRMTRSVLFLIQRFCSSLWSDSKGFHWKVCEKNRMTSEFFLKKLVYSQYVRFHDIFTL